MDFLMAEDAELWQSFRMGNRDAFAAIYKKFFKNIYEYGLRLHNDPEIVQDSIQDLFINLWAKKENLSDVKSIKAYLLISLRNLIFNKNKKSIRQSLQNQKIEKEFEMVFSVEAGFIEKETISAQTKVIFDALNKLSSRQKEFLYLKYFEELNTDEIAELMEITVKATYKLSARSLDAIKKLLTLSSPHLMIVFAVARAELFG